MKLKLGDFKRKIDERLNILAESVKKIVDAVPILLDFPAKKFHVDYGKLFQVLKELQRCRLQMGEC